MDTHRRGLTRPAAFALAAGILCLASGCARSSGIVALPASRNAAFVHPQALRHGAAAKVDWKTMGFDLARTGYNPDETVIGPGSFSTYHKLWTVTAGGDIGEPALAAGVTINGVSTDVLYVPLTTSGIVAINAATGAVIWTRKYPYSIYYCGSTKDKFGSHGAPTIDRTTNRVYMTDGINKVHALNLVTGNEIAGWPITVAAQTDHDFIQSGLTYNPANKMLYVATASTCDISPWHGRLSAIDTVHASIVNKFLVTQGYSGGGIWGFGGASIDTATNHVYVATGNADTAKGNAQNAFYGEQVLELSPDLSTILAHNYPGLPPGSDDEDFGATPMLFQPAGCGPLLVAVNKSGTLYLYSRMSIASGPVQAIQLSIVSGNGDLIGVPSYDPVTNLVYVGLPATKGIYKPGMAAFSVTSKCLLNPTPAWTAAFGADGSLMDTHTPRSPVTLANGVAFVSDYVTQTTYAFNAASGAQLWRKVLQGGGIVGPVVVNGREYIGSTGTTMTAWSP